MLDFCNVALIGLYLSLIGQNTRFYGIIQGYQNILEHRGNTNRPLKLNIKP